MISVIYPENKVRERGRDSIEAGIRKKGLRGPGKGLRSLRNPSTLSPEFEVLSKYKGYLYIHNSVNKKIIYKTAVIQTRPFDCAKLRSRKATSFFFFFYLIYIKIK